jgi:hypothetical protein
MAGTRRDWMIITARERPGLEAKTASERKGLENKRDWRMKRVGAK